MIHLSSAKGFTLMEMLIYIAIISIVAVGFITFGIDITTSAQKSRVQTYVHQSARFAMERMLQEIRSASALNEGSSTFDTHPGVLSLEKTDLAQDPTVIDTNAGVLRLTLDANAPELLTPDDLVVSSLIFTNLSVTGRTANIRVEMTLEHPNPENDEIFNAAATVTGSAVIRLSEI